MSLRALELGIKAVQMGSTVEGARLLRYALKRDARDSTLQPDQRATAYIWLAETSSDVTYKRGCYAQAAATARDPNLAANARERMNALTSSLTSQPSIQMERGSANLTVPDIQSFGANIARGVPPLHMERGLGGEVPVAANANTALCVARVVDGVNGVGTAYFVDGLWATSRRVIGGMERVTVELHGRGQRGAAVVRSSPELDIALLLLDDAAAVMPPSVPPTVIVPLNQEIPLVALAFDGTITRGSIRPTRRAMPEHWLPTDFTTIPDAGGDPLFDPQNRFVGILTRNTARNADHLFGVAASAIQELVAAARRQLTGETRVYCPTCGSGSRALAAGFFYCETCGAVSAAAVTITRTPNPQSETYYSPGGAPCRTCGAAAGSYQGKCLRCGGAA